MSDSRWATLGTLGGPGTFAGQAAVAAIARFPELGHVEYFPTMDDSWAAIRDGRVDRGLLGSETTHTGFVEMAEVMLDRTRPLYVAGEVIAAYNCLLLGKPGASIDQIKLVLGHGSVLQCGAFFAERLPGADVRIHHQNSVAAAREVLDGDGSVAVVATEYTARQAGLAVLEAGIDRGSAAAWWILTPSLAVSPTPDVFIVGLHARERGTLEELVTRAASLGLAVRSIASANQGTLFDYAHLIVFTGRGRASDAETLVAGIDGGWLLGAFDSAAATLPGISLSSS